MRQGHLIGSAARPPGDHEGDRFGRRPGGMAAPATAKQHPAKNETARQWIDDFFFIVVLLPDLNPLLGLSFQNSVDDAATPKAPGRSLRHSNVSPGQNSRIKRSR